MEISNNYFERGENENFDLDSLLPRLEHLRTLIVYNTPYAARSLLFYHILPHFSSKNIFIAVYSDTMYRRLEKTYESILKSSPDIAKLLDRAKIIKIGSKDRTSFGELYELINPDLNWHRNLSDVVKGLGEDDVLLFHGFSIIPTLYGRKAMIDMLKLLDQISEDVTLINKCSKKLYDGQVEKVMERLYDVVLRVERSEGEFLGFEESYMIGVDQSIIMNI
ncbi:hypothetical protein [Archaeoglobus veneficus]|uniref:Uncharacterized protein n=1 Tax=Archaeoglobus veneficus (strain DSM 11195 / SNP6) TaxID=693661 RepID=F2KT81_ARCVS|nr:hypothetical protein [Archaeoglobus veneficus]AEA47111.1 hypothetical protein Arcve_1101 [Archaeoglobus veneficus SNP6]